MVPAAARVAGLAVATDTSRSRRLPRGAVMPPSGRGGAIGSGSTPRRAGPPKCCHSRPGAPNVLHVLRRWAALPKGARWVVGVFVTVVVALGIAWVLLVPAAGWLAQFDVGSAKGSQLQTARDAAQGRLLTLGAGLFAAGALIFTARNYTLSREGQVTDRYTKAIEQLGSDSLDVRTGGIYALERVARDSARDHPTVMDVLTAFVREQSRKQWPEVDDQSGADVPLRTTRPDVQAAVAVIGRRDPKNDRQAVNLNSANLTGADLTGAKLAGAKLNGGPHRATSPTRTSPARSSTADLTGAQRDLTGAQLTRQLTGADLTSARLADAWLPDVDFTSADLVERESHRREPRWGDAHRRGPKLRGPDRREPDQREPDRREPLPRVPHRRSLAAGCGCSGRLATRLRLRPPGRTRPLPREVPDWIREHLFPAERIVITIRKHPVIILPAIIWILFSQLSRLCDRILLSPRQWKVRCVDRLGAVGPAGRVAGPEDRHLVAGVRRRNRAPDDAGRRCV